MKGLKYVGAALVLATGMWATGVVATGPTRVAAQEPDAAAEFQSRLSEWKQLLAKLRELAVQFKTVKPSERGPIDKQYREMVAKGAQMFGPLVSAAEAAYVAAPDNSTEAADLLAQFAKKAATETDDYEEASRLAKILLDHGFANPEITELAGVAAFQTGNLDEAEKRLAQAAPEKKPSEVALRLAGEIASMRPLWQKEQELRQAEAAADDLPRVLLKTSKGDVVVELFENEAPNTVANFISLVEKKFYDGLKFHRVLSGFMAQGGDPKGDGTGGPDYSIACECYQENHRNHFRGTLSMAHAGRDTGGSQFYITFVPTTHLNGKHTVFGRVIEGMGAVSKFKRANPEQARSGGADADKIIEAKVIRKREHEYKPVTGPPK